MNQLRFVLRKSITFVYHNNRASLIIIEVESSNGVIRLNFYVRTRYYARLKLFLSYALI